MIYPIFSLKRRGRILASIFLIAVLAFKTAIISLPVSEIVEVGERPNGAWSSACQLTSPYDIHELVNGGAPSSQKCSLYWNRHSMRGFYLHHYSSLLSETNSSSLPPLLRSARHQYGAAGLLIVDVASMLKLTITPLQYAISSLWVGLAGLLTVARIPIWVKTANEDEYTVYIAILALALGALNVDQFLLSPGFTPLRILPILGVIVAYRLIPSHSRVENPRPSQLIKPTALGLLLLSCMSMSSQFLLMTVSSFLCSLSCLYLSALNRSLKSGLGFVVSITKNKPLWTCLLISFLSYCAMSILSANHIFSLGTSVGDTILSKKPLLIIASVVLVCLMFFGTRSIAQQVPLRRGLLNVFREPVLYQLLFFAGYPAHYWGSPNHLYLFMLLAAYPLSTVLFNVYHGYSILPSKSDIFILGTPICLLWTSAWAYILRPFISESKTICRWEKVREQSLRRRGLVISGLAYSRLDFFQRLRHYSPRVLFYILPKALVITALLTYASTAVRGFSRDFSLLNGEQKTKYAIFEHCNFQHKLGIFLIRSCNKPVSANDLVLYQRSSKVAGSKSRLVLSDLALFLPHSDFIGSEYGFPSNKQALANSIELQLSLEGSLYNYNKCINKSTSQNLGLLRAADRVTCDLIVSDYTASMAKMIEDKASLHEIDSSSVLLDKSLDREVKQLYVFMHSSWLSSGKIVTAEPVKEIWAKLARYVWRIQLMQMLESSRLWSKG